MLAEVLSVFEPLDGATVVDCTLGYGGHATELLQRVGPTGRLVGFDLDASNLPDVQEHLSTIGHPFSLHHSNFAAIPTILGEQSIDGADAILADLGMSSMQVDDADRGFSFMREGPLDMRMDRSRGRTASELVMTLSAEELATAFRELGDEPDAERIANAIVAERETTPLERTTQLRELIERASPVKVQFIAGKHNPTARQQQVRPAARVFQSLRILVNRELANLQHLLRMLPHVLKPGGKAVLISFHSGEDRLIKSAFKEGQHKGIYSRIADEPLRPDGEERFVNPRSRSAKLRWAELKK